MGVQKERKSTFLTVLNNGKKRLAVCLLHNIDIAVVSECLCHLRAQHPIQSQIFVLVNRIYVLTRIYVLILVLFWYENNGDPLHFSETNFEPLTASSRDCIKKNVNFCPKVPNLPYKPSIKSKKCWESVLLLSRLDTY